MSGRKTPPTSGSASGPKPADSREDRLKAALKANLARRKSQARARAAGAGDAEATEDPGEDNSRA